MKRLAAKLLSLSASLGITVAAGASPLCTDVTTTVQPVAAGASPLLTPATAAVPVTAVTPITTVIDRDVVYSTVSNEVIPRIEPSPAVVAPVDNIKLQINNRINAGLISGMLTNEEADEVRAALDAVSVREAEFKLELGGLTLSAVANLMPKFHMVNQMLEDRLNNTNIATIMPNFEMRRQGLQRRIQYHSAAGNLTPGEGEQLLAALSQVSDLYADARATGGVVTADELEALHKDLSTIQAKLTERVGGTIAFVAPATHDQLAKLRARIESAVAMKQVTDTEACALWQQYNRLVLLQDSIIADEGLRSPDIQLLAKEIDNLDFILTRELRDRQIAGQSNKL